MDYMELVEDIRYTIGVRQLYDKRKETIERCFVDDFIKRLDILPEIMYTITNPCGASHTKKARRISMATNPMSQLTYGLFVLTANVDGKDNGCIINTVGQVTATPNRITIAVNKANYTHDMLMKNNLFTVSVISEKADFSLFKRFGFASGRDTDKFSGFSAIKRTENGTLAVTEGTNSYLSGRIFHSIDLGTHTLFIAEVTEAVTLNDTPSATYAYYHANIKPKPEKVGETPKGETIWRCTICGYEYVGEELPVDFICPLCKHPASDFEKVT